MTSVSTTENVVVIQHSDGTFLYYDGSGYPKRTSDVTSAADFSWGDPGSIRRNHMDDTDTLVEYTRTITMTPTGRTGKDAFKTSDTENETDMEE